MLQRFFTLSTSERSDAAYGRRTHDDRNRPWQGAFGLPLPFKSASLRSLVDFAEKSAEALTSSIIRLTVFRLIAYTRPNPPSMTYTCPVT